MMYPVVFIGFFGVVRFVPDFFALERGFLTPPFETDLGVLGAAFPFGVFVEAVGADFLPPVGVFASAARVVARFVGATFFFLLFVRAGFAFFVMTMRVGLESERRDVMRWARDPPLDGKSGKMVHLYWTRRRRRRRRRRTVGRRTQRLEYSAVCYKVLRKD